MLHPIFGDFAANSYENLIAEKVGDDRDTSFIDKFIVENIDDLVFGKIDLPLRDTHPIAFKQTPPHAFRGRTYSDQCGLWDEMPSDTLPGPGDFIDDEDVLWRLRPPSKPRSTSPQDEHDYAVRVAAEARKRVEALSEQLGESDPRIEHAREIMRVLYVCSLEKMKKLEAWQEAGHGDIWSLGSWDTSTPEGLRQKHAAIDEYRRTPKGREEFNAKRRTTDRGPNANLSDATEVERIERRRQQKAKSERRRRASKKELTMNQSRAKNFLSFD